MREWSGLAKKYGRSNCILLEGIIPTFDWRNRGKPLEALLWTFGATHIWIQVTLEASCSVKVKGKVVRTKP
jgi:hypothetical protein